MALILLSLGGCATRQIALERPDNKTELQGEIDGTVCEARSVSVSEYAFCMQRLGYKLVSIPN